MITKERVLVRVSVFVFVLLCTLSFSWYLRAGYNLQQKTLRHLNAQRSALDEMENIYHIDVSLLKKEAQLLSAKLTPGYLVLLPWMTQSYEQKVVDLHAAIRVTYQNRYAQLLQEASQLELDMGDLYKAHVDKKVLAISALGTYADAQSGVMASFPTPDKSTKDDLLRIEGRIAEMRGRYDAGLNAVYEYKKEERDGLVRTMQSDFDMYIQFFNARKIETELISELHNARTLLKVGSNTQKLLDIVRDIDTMKNEIYPLLARAQVKRDAIRQAEAQERQTKMDELAKAQSTVPEAPIKEGKVIFVSIQTQRLYAYEDGVPIFNYPVPVTTGKRNYNTVTGEYKIYQKHRNFTMRSPFPNDPYVLFVKYWMPFYSGYGLHDAPWRSAFGGPGFLNDGTHGCVNMREHEVAKIYNWASVGTPVIVQ